MYFPDYRPRRLRRTENLRRMIRETTLSVDDLIYPLFVAPGTGVKDPIGSMPGQYHFSVDELVKEAAAVKDLGIPAIILFGLPETKDEVGSSGYDPEGIVQRGLRAIKDEVDGLVLITDVCLCEYTSHGHCGVLKDEEVDNDATLELLARMALSHARAGADMVAPSDMMDGRVAEIRGVLDEEGFSHIPIMSYAVKFASAFYGPFREAAQSAPSFGDRRGYQMDPANAREALRETALDVEEGADIVMVKPAMAFMDIISLVREEFPLPVAAYNVSGEYAMVKAAAEKGWIDEKKIVIELLTGIKRAGADMILTYHAPDVARWLKEIYRQRL
ncbi:MAG: porphobilinogen synthase [Deltaproteobacteria bacterium]|nr:porphobilinogen synthase [Deltaproteobacteria bacterium]